MKLERLFGKTADKATKDHPGAREAGMIGGSALVGGAVGLSTLGAAENADKGRKKVIKLLEKNEGRKLKKAIEKIDNIAATGKLGEDTVKTSKELAKSLTEDNIKDIHQLSKKLKRITKPVSKFARTKGGKAVLIGAPTAIIGGVTYASAKKKDKKNK